MSRPPLLHLLLISLTLSLVLLAHPAGCVAAPVGPRPRPEPAVLIRFERTACFGPCPVDVLTIFADGRMRYQGQEHGPRTGTYAGRLSPAERQALTQAFAAARFFEFAPAYVSDRTDLPTSYLSYASAGRQHRVQDYDGAPPTLKALEARLAALIDAPGRWRRQR